MKTQLHTMLLIMLAGWLNRHQQNMIDYLRTENKILLEKIGKKRILLNNEQRIRLGILAKKIGRKALFEICNAFSPDTLLCWHRRLIACKYDGSSVRKYGRPQISEELAKLIIKIAKANRGWGSPRIKGQLKYLGYQVSHKTIDNIRKKYGLEPKPKGKKNTTWTEFIKSHWQSLAAIDFTTIEVYTQRGLVRYMILAVIDYSTRKVEIAGVIPQANGSWMAQIARNLTDSFTGFLKDKKYLIHDHDPLFTKEFKQILKSVGIEAIRTPPLSPNLSPFIERFFRSLKSECLNRMLIFGECHLKYLINEYIQHYHAERAHQGLDNEIIEPLSQGDGEIVCQERLGGLLKFYRRAA